jgi:hypothetical protein
MFGSSVDSLAAAAPVPTKAPVLVDQALATEKAPAIVPTETVAPVPTITVAPIATASNPPSAFLGVTQTPAINIPTLTRNIVYLFAGVLLVVLLVDAWVVSRKKIVRVAGHNIAHFLFLSAVVIAVSLINSRGSLL